MHHTPQLALVSLITPFRPGLIHLVNFFEPWWLIEPWGGREFVPAVVELKYTINIPKKCRQSIMLKVTRTYSTNTPNQLIVGNWALNIFSNKFCKHNWLVRCSLLIIFDLSNLGISEQIFFQLCKGLSCCLFCIGYVSAEYSYKGWKPSRVVTVRARGVAACHWYTPQMKAGLLSH